MTEATPRRDDDPVHPTFDGIVFISTTDQKGIIVSPAVAIGPPPISYLPIAVAVGAATDIEELVKRVRAADPQSYLGDYLDRILDDFTAAILACQSERPH